VENLQCAALSLTAGRWPLDGARGFSGRWRADAGLQEPEGVAASARPRVRGSLLAVVGEIETGGHLQPRMDPWGCRAGPTALWGGPHPGDDSTCRGPQGLARLCSPFPLAAALLYAARTPADGRGGLLELHWAQAYSGAGSLLLALLPEPQTASYASQQAAVASWLSSRGPGCCNAPGRGLRRLP